MTSSPQTTLSQAEARRIALAAQGFANAPRLRRRHPFDPALERLHVLQIDSVNVFARSHYLPVFSRHGGYDADALDRHLWHGDRFTEYWAHEAAFVPVADRRLFGWRMDDFRDRYRRDGRSEAFAATVDRVRARLADDGPQLVGELEEGPRGKRGPWWDWSATKRAVEMLFAWGEVVSVGREGFQRRYALAEQALRPEHLAPVERERAQRLLVERAARSLGVATLADLADYHRLKTADARIAMRALEEGGELVPVRVAGWETKAGRPEAAWIHRDARVPSRLAPDALLTPFDPMVWFRPRAERMFDFHYRIEIYTPQEKRRYGYYCLPLMVGGGMAGRIDLKADRPNRALLVQAAWREDRAPARTAETARQLLAAAAAWQGLSEVRVSGAGNLPLRRASTRPDGGARPAGETSARAVTARDSATTARRQRHDSAAREAVSMTATRNDWAVEADGLVKVFGDNRAVDGVDLRVKTGTVYGVLGPNGAGKTTTINMLATLMRPDGGTGRIFGHDVVRDPQIVRQLIGVTGQFASVDEALSANENLMIFARLLGIPRGEARLRAEELLERFGLTEAAKRPLKNFSGGMRRRLDLAASLLAQPPLIFLDEPTTGLDPRTRGQMWDTIRDLVSTGSTVLLTTQYLDEADQLADRIAVIDRGRVVAEGTPDELKASVGTSSLQLRLADETRTGEALRAIERVLGVHGALSPEASRITAPMAEADRVTDLLIALREAGIRLTEMSVQKPTLDEVFLTITGHDAADRAQGDADPHSADSRAADPHSSDSRTADSRSSDPHTEEVPA